MVKRWLRSGLFLALLLGASPGEGVAQELSPPKSCGLESPLSEPPRLVQFRCRYQVSGDGFFGLPYWGGPPVYRTTHPLPGMHLVGVAGLPGPEAGESFERWEWRMLRARFPASVQEAYRALDRLHPFFASRLLQLEARLRTEGISFHRRETWRSPERQAYLFQRGRSRAGSIVTTTLTSWHSRVDERGLPTGLAADYTIAPGRMGRFHALVAEVGLASYGAESSDPGHVFAPEAEAVEAGEAELLRWLPRVEGVVLATGRPADEIPSPSLRAWYQERSREMAAGPFPELALPVRSPPRASIRTGVALRVAEGEAAK